MSLSYCAIDFETAHWFRGSPCAVGLVKVVDGAVVDTRRCLMRPPKGCDEFDEFNISLHGITPEMVQHEPRFAQRLPEDSRVRRRPPLRRSQRSLRHRRDP